MELSRINVRCTVHFTQQAHNVRYPKIDWHAHLVVDDAIHEKLYAWIEPSSYTFQINIVYWTLLIFSVSRTNLSSPKKELI